MAIEVFAQTDYSNTLGFPSIAPDRYGLPGSSVALSITGGIIFYAILLTLVGVVLSAGLWAVGSFSNNQGQTVNGKRGFLVCAGCALAIGAAYFLLNWFFGTGQNIT